MSEYRIAIDVGGTFTDVVAVDRVGRVTFAKAQSTPGNQAEGVLEGLARLADEIGIAPGLLLARTERIVHGMTVATNALLERKGARVGLLTTAGHRDVLEMREGLKPERYDLRLPRPEPLVPRHLRLGVVERLRADGSVHTPLDAASLERALTRLERAKVTSIAVCYLHAYRDPVHEIETRARIEARMPQAYVSLSSEVLPQIKEYQRVSTTVVNAYVGPLIARYLGALEAELAARGFAGPLLVMLSHGGVAPVEEAVRIAAGTVLSGPAGGLAGARRVGGVLGAPDLVPLDMGGTSTDISLVVGGESALSLERPIAGERIALPSLEIVTLGAGGGSIARTVEGGLLRVGPESAGASPGPAAYGRGGTEATVTDASVVLGYLDPEAFLGGRATLDRTAAERALARLGRDLGLDAVQAAEGVHRVVNTHMAEGIRLATVRRGVDPRRFALLGFGGAAGLHATELARMLGIVRVIVPRVASVLSAWACWPASCARKPFVPTSARPTGSTPRACAARSPQWRPTGAVGWARGSTGRILVRRSADMRYGEQIFEIDVALDDVDLEAPDVAARLKAAFEARHEALYTYSLPEQAPIVVNARVATVGVLPEPPREPSAASDEAAAPAGVRSIYLGRWLEVPVYAFDRLGAGQTIAGPAVIESETTTVLLRSGDEAHASAERWLDVKVGP